MTHLAHEVQKVIEAATKLGLRATVARVNSRGGRYSEYFVTLSRGERDGVVRVANHRHSLATEPMADIGAVDEWRGATHQAAEDVIPILGEWFRVEPEVVRSAIGALSDRLRAEHVDAALLETIAGRQAACALEGEDVRLGALSATQRRLGIPESEVGRSAARHVAVRLTAAVAGRVSARTLRMAAPHHQVVVGCRVAESFSGPPSMESLRSAVWDALVGYPMDLRCAQDAYLAQAWLQTPSGARPPRPKRAEGPSHVDIESLLRVFRVRERVRLATVALIVRGGVVDAWGVVSRAQYRLLVGEVLDGDDAALEPYRTEAEIWAAMGTDRAEVITFDVQEWPAPA